ncbi:MAG: fibronectin type III domain-containing protein, partial [Cocleimonas sp.]
NVNADVPTRDGSVLLVAYNTDVTFGNVIIKPLSGLSDTVSPVLSNIKISAVTHSTATITWETNEPSNSVINYGLNSQYGSKEISATQTKTHSLTLSGLSSNTSYHYQVRSADSNNNTASSGDRIFTTKDSSSIGLVSDDFNGNIETSVWSFYDPAGDSTLSTTGTQATISVSAGSSHDLWKNNLLAPRIRQAANNTDFEVEVKFDSTLSAKYQGNGMTVEQDPANLLRFDFYTDGAVTYIFSASFVGGPPQKRIQLAITKGASLYLRVTREGDQWTTSYSTDGSSWTVAGVYTHSLNVTSVAIFGGNAGSNPPEHNVLADYFRVNSISSN